MANTSNPKKNTNKKNVSKNKKRKEKKLNIRQLLIILCTIITVLTIGISLSFGFFAYYRSGKTQSGIYTANLNIVVNDEASIGINDENAFPVYDEVGKKTDPYMFTLENLGSVAANYVMKLVPDTDSISKDLCSDNLLDDKVVKFQLIKDGVIVKEARLSELDDYVIDSGFIGLVDDANSYSYQLRLWIASDAGKEVMGKHYHGKIQVEVIDPTKS